MFRFDSTRLAKLAAEHRTNYAQASPFAHAVLDDFLPEVVPDRILDEFPGPGACEWQVFDNPAERKLTNRDERTMGDNTLFLVHELNSARFIEFLESLTGITGLIPDPHSVGGGLHLTERGGFLKVHADFNRHDQLRLDRRLNLLLYLNRGWKEEYGGHLELWNRQMTRCEKRILPVFNRCVVFDTAPFSYHGHPEPLTCPEGQNRKSLALYYYTNGRPSVEAAKPRSTVFQARPGERAVTPHPRLQARDIVKKLSPPILLDALRYLRKASR